MLMELEASVINLLFLKPGIGDVSGRAVRFLGRAGAAADTRGRDGNLGCDSSFSMGFQRSRGISRLKKPLIFIF